MSAHILINVLGFTCIFSPFVMVLLGINHLCFLINILFSFFTYHCISVIVFCMSTITSVDVCIFFTKHLPKEI